MEPDDRLTVSVEEAAKLLGISRGLAYELVARGELPSLRLGRRRVVPLVGIHELIGDACARNDKTEEPAGRDPQLPGPRRLRLVTE